MCQSSELDFLPGITSGLPVVRSESSEAPIDLSNARAKQSLFRIDSYS
jgi:hypothetical protein